MARYWNGYQWVEDPPMASAEPKFDMSDVKEALLEAELNPRTRTSEDVPFEVEIEEVEPQTVEVYSQLKVRRPSADLIIEEIPLPEQPTPNLVDRSVEVFSRNSPRLEEHEEPTISRVSTRDRQELTGQDVASRLETLAENKEFQDLTRQAILDKINSIPQARDEDMIKASEEDVDKTVIGDEVVITDEARARIRRELGMKDDGSAE